MTNEYYKLYTSKFKHMPIFFLDGQFHVESIDASYDTCFFHTDTLFVTMSNYKSGIGSTDFIVDTVFMGKIIQIDNDSLKIERIKDNIFIFNNPLEYRTLKFYNDQLITKYPTEFKAISLSTGECYGSCPIQAIELYEDGRFFFFGGPYSTKQGYYSGHMKISTVDSLKHFLSAFLINKDVFRLYGKPNDAPGCEIKIIMENNDTIIIDGTPSMFNYRLWQTYTLLRRGDYSECWTKDSIPHTFLSNKYLKK